MKGRIYKISCKSDPNLVYVGSTTKPLRERLLEHKYKCKTMYRNAKLYQQINDNDWSDWGIELIEEVEFDEVNDLRMREGEYIKSIGTLNHRIAGQDDKESMKQYRENNIEKIKERKKQYRQKNRAQINKYKKEYHQKNKEVLNKYRRDVCKADKHYRHTLLKKCFNAFKNHHDDLIVDCNI